MRFLVQPTSEGFTVYDSWAGECFKSRHAPQQEVREVFFQPGVLENPWWTRSTPFRILELGLGLGTNFQALLREKLVKKIEFVTLEKDLSGAKFFLEQSPSRELQELLENKRYQTDFISSELVEGDFFEILPNLKAKEKFHCVYFDPFSPKANPEAWSPQLFQLVADLVEPSGRLVTYSVSRAAKDSALQAGFSVHKRNLSPALRKRSALLAIRNSLPFE